jgi:hypothetical protein
MNRTRRVAIYIGATLAIMADTIRHLFGDSRPIDILMLVIEVLVLVIIAYEAIKETCSRRRIRAITSQLRLFLIQGQKLYDSPPPSASTTAQDDNAWSGRVQAWTDSVQKFLNEKADSAAVVFNHLPIRNDTKPRAYVSHRIERVFIDLDERLKTLRSIMEKPNVYF